MKLSRVAGRGLAELAKGLRVLSNGSHQTEVQKELGKEAVALVREGIQAGSSPEGEAWDRTRDGRLALQPLAAHVEYRPLPPNPLECAVEVRVNHWTAHFAQRGTVQHGMPHNPERHLVPEDQPPRAWLARIRATAGVAFSAAVRRAVGGG